MRPALAHPDGAGRRARSVIAQTTILPVRRQIHKNKEYLIIPRVVTLVECCGSCLFVTEDGSGVAVTVAKRPRGGSGIQNRGLFIGLRGFLSFYSISIYLHIYIHGVTSELDCFSLSLCRDREYSTCSRTVVSIICEELW